MGKKCVVVAHREQEYKLYSDDIAKIIYKRPSRFPPIPIYQSTHSVHERRLRE